MRRRDLLAVVGVAAFGGPFAVHAQQKAMPLVGILAEAVLFGSSFAKGLEEIGYVRFRNVALEEHRGLGRYDELAAFASDFVSREVAVIAAFGSGAALAAKRATSTVPIVFASGEPVAEGLVTSLARPGANLTGVSLMYGELTSKRLELLSELVPRASTFALLVNPGSSTAAIAIQHAQQAARGKGVVLHILNAGSIAEIDAALDDAARLYADAILIDANPFFIYNAAYFVNITSNRAIPAISASDSYPWAGGLMSYGADWEAAFHQVGTYVGRILRGTKPADLPVQLPTKFDLVINMKTARALGLAIPQSLLARADQVIE